MIIATLQQISTTNLNIFTEIILNYRRDKILEIITKSYVACSGNKKGLAFYYRVNFQKIKIKKNL